MLFFYCNPLFNDSFCFGAKWCWDTDWFFITYSMQEFRRDPNPSCLDSPLFTVGRVNAFLHNLDVKLIAMIHWLLETALALQTMVVQIPQRRAREEEKYKQFLTKLGDLKGAESRAEIRVIEGKRVVEIGRWPNFPDIERYWFYLC